MRAGVDDQLGAQLGFERRAIDMGVETGLVIVADRQQEGVDVVAGAELGGRGAGLGQDGEHDDKGKPGAGHGRSFKLKLPFGI